MSLAVTVVITSYEDERIEATLDSLAGQDRQADAILIADGSRDDDFRTWLARAADAHGASIVHEAGASVARARNLALAEASTDVLAFLDTDQRAPAGWLGALVAPLEAGDAQWTGGPTRPEVSLPLMALKEDRLYAAARADATRIPMGNSAWLRAVLQEVGGFDERLDRGGEDWDVALRAHAAGHRGRVVDDAWVHHDLSRLDSYATIAAKQFRYNVGGAMAYLKNRRLSDRLSRSPPHQGFHWFDLVEPGLKAAALPVAWWRLRRD